MKMRIHNLIEDLVLKWVDEIFSDEKKQEKCHYLINEESKLDVACFVLNRMEPRYSISERGLAHFKAEISPQLNADIETLIYEGLRRVSRNIRPLSNTLSSNIPKSGPFFNFPTIIGRIFFGNTFEPVRELSIALYQEDKLVEMMAPAWQNPYPLSEIAPGSFQFWPLTVKADSESREFPFEVRIRSSGFEDIHHHFVLRLKREKELLDTYQASDVFKIEDLYLFPEGEEEDS